MFFLTRGRTFVVVVTVLRADDDFLFLDKSNQALRGVMKSETTLPFEYQLSEGGTTPSTNK